MDEGAGPASPAGASAAWLVLGLGLAAWLVSFTLLARSGSWAPFALAGAALGIAAILSGRETRALLRPTFATAAAGLGAGLLQVALTHAGFALASSASPALRAAAGRLFVLLEVGGYAPGARAALIVLIASCEELVFRGALLGPARRRAQRLWRRVGGEDLLRVAGLAAAYGLAMATLGSGLLLVVAFACGLAWGWLRVGTRSLVPPILAHVVWDLGVLVVWPLVRSG